jgi:hypothetical protein
MEDARQDPRCANHPGVIGRPNLRFYIGAPLLSRGHIIGLYYLADSEPCPSPSEEQIAKLVDIANDAVAALQEDMFNCLLGGAENNNKSINKDSIELPAVWIDVSTPKWRILGVNTAWETLTGVSYNDLKDARLLEVMIASNEGGLVDAVEATQSHPEHSIPAILSPCAPNGVSLQYIFAIKPAVGENAPPASAIAAAAAAAHASNRSSVDVNLDGDIYYSTAQNNGPPITTATTATTTIWKAEVHARVQAAADITGNFEIDPSGMAHRLLPSTDPYFGSLLPVPEYLIHGSTGGSTTTKNSTIYSPGITATTAAPVYTHQYQYHMYQHQHPVATSRNGDASSGSGGGGGGGGGRGSGGSSSSGSGGKHHPAKSLPRGELSASGSAPLLVSARSVLEVGSMHIPPRLATLQIGPLLGRGSYGSVYWGTLGDNGVAIKVMQQAPGPEAGEQLWAAQYEAMVASDLSHDNLVRTIDWCCHYEGSMNGGVMWIVQELCNKGSLAIAIKEGALRVDVGNVESAPDMRAVLETAADVAYAMAYLHSHDVLHGDLSSNNVLFISDDNNRRGFRAKVSDFGLARALGGQDCATKTVGTISHMPPELLTSGVMAKGGDVYSFGVMLWELYTGKRAWGGSSQAQVIFAITCKQTMLQLPSDAPPGYAALTTACMDRERLNRPGFDEIVKTLGELLAAEVAAPPQIDT